MAINAAQVQAASKEGSQKSNIEELDKIVIPKTISDDEFTQERKKDQVYNVIFRLIKKKKGRSHLDNCCDNVKNPKTGKPERIWLLSGANSIWDSDLENILKDKNRYERARRNMDIMFVDGVCRVSSDDSLRLEFLRLNKKNVGKNRSGASPFDYYEYDPQEEAKIRMQKQLMKIEMIGRAKDMEIGKAKKLAAYFGIAFNDEIGLPKGDDAIRTELMLKADNDPSTFQKFMDSEEVEISYLVKRAIIDSKIEYNAENGSVHWSNGKGFIARIPSNRKHYEYLSELAMDKGSEGGKRFLEQLKQIVT